MLYRHINGEPHGLVRWPWSQAYMGERWFDEEAKLENGALYEAGMVSGSSYWIPVRRLNEEPDAPTC